MSELGENIQTLEEQKEVLDEKWESVKNEIGDISKFFKTTLTKEEKTKLEGIISQYNGNKNFLENERVSLIKESKETSEVKDKLIESKKNFYKEIVPFISSDKLSGYLEFIKNDVEINEKGKDVKEELYKDKVALQEKVSTLREKIEENKKVLETRIENLIREKLSEKFNALKSDSRFQKFTTKQKIQLFEKTLEGVLDSKETLLNQSKSNSLLEKKIAVYQIVIDYLQKEISQLELLLQ